jgi:hypothetical protein
LCLLSGAGRLGHTLNFLTRGRHVHP